MERRGEWRVEHKNLKDDLCRSCMQSREHSRGCTVESIRREEGGEGTVTEESQRRYIYMYMSNLHAM